VGDSVIGLVAVISSAADAVVDDGWDTVLTVIDEITDLGTVAEDAVAALTVVGGMRDPIFDLVAAVYGTGHAVV